jgi:hypothetical protein
MDRSLPGADLVERGLADLAAGVESIEALLVSIGAPRLCALGFPVERPLADPERRLYDRLAAADPDAAHGRYNALVRRLVSFERAAECVNPRT